MTADQAIAEHESRLRGETEERPAPERTEAEAFLRTFLADGARPAKEVNEAAQAAAAEPIDRL